MNNYNKMLLMITVSFIIMYAVMFLNVSQSDHIYLSLTRLYMSLLMVSPMAIMMLLFMPMMYKSQTKNKVIITTASIVFAFSLFGLRQQIFISDVQYMKAMIPHHSSAILTSERASVRDPEVKALSLKIIETQKNEIRQMKAMISRLEHNNKDLTNDGLQTHK